MVLDDIPCSSVGNSEDVGKWTMPQLKFWLKCRKLNQKDLKSDLVEVPYFVLPFVSVPPGYVRCVPD